MKIRLRGRLKGSPIAKACLDADELASGVEGQSEKQLIRTLKTTLAAADACLIQQFEQQVDVNELVKARAWVVEQLILHAWHTLIPEGENVSLVAVGGFGRGELH
ncbi:MAG: hypothetical protein KJO80_09075, partial [Gammaproteobacteria bacterium]|nr:hypothetical protein [Gammaproteobacteria bacterium]